MSEQQLMAKYQRYVAMCNRYGFQPLPYILYQLGVGRHTVR